MPRTCTICRHPSRHVIETSLVAGTPNRRIAADHGVSETALRRHRQQHLAEELARARETEEIAYAESLLRDIASLRRRTLAILDAAEASGDLRTAIAAIREARGHIDLLARLIGQIGTSTNVNIVVSPEWMAMRDGILGALALYPDARVAVAERIVELEHGDYAVS